MTVKPNPVRFLTISHWNANWNGTKTSVVCVCVCKYVCQRVCVPSCMHVSVCTIPQCEVKTTSLSLAAAYFQLRKHHYQPAGQRLQSDSGQYQLDWMIVSVGHSLTLVETVFPRSLAIWGVGAEEGRRDRFGSVSLKENSMNADQAAIFVSWHRIHRVREVSYPLCTGGISFSDCMLFL